jgi:hypothetical protein
VVRGSAEGFLSGGGQERGGYDGSRVLVQQPKETNMSALQIVTKNGKPEVYTWADGFKARREESLLEQASKSDEDLLRVCLWLENHDHKEEAIALLERVLH